MAYADIVAHRLNTTIEVGPLRRELEKLIAGGQTWTSMARQLGWTRMSISYDRRGNKTHRKYLCGDGGRLMRAVGVRPYRNKRAGEKTYQTRITFELAEYICDGLEISYIDIGL